METIEYGLAITDNEWGGYKRKDLIKVKVGHKVMCELAKIEIDNLKKELPELLRKGESLHLTTHVDHDDYFIVEVVRSDKWPEHKYMEVRILSYTGGCLFGGWSAYVDLGDESEIQDFIEDIFE